MLLFLLTLITALAISGIAAYFSIIGLAALFAAAFWPVVIMGTTLEVAKLVATAWLHQNWKNIKVSYLHKFYMFLAIVALMIITSVGIYGFLSKGHLEQDAPLKEVELQINQKRLSLEQIEQEKISNEKRLQILDKSLDVLLNNDRATQALTAKKQQEKERSEIRKLIDNSNQQASQLRLEILKLQQSTLDVEAKLGPIKYIAALFSWDDTGTAVRFVILILMFAFDPLAVVLVISATITLNQWNENRKKIKEDKKGIDIKEVIIEKVIEKPVEIIKEVIKEIPVEKIVEVPQTQPEVDPDVKKAFDALQNDPKLLSEVLELMKKEIDETKQTVQNHKVTENTEEEIKQAEEVRRNQPFKNLKEDKGWLSGFNQK